MADRVKLPDGTPVSEKWAPLYELWEPDGQLEGTGVVIRNLISDLSRAEARIEQMRQALTGILIDGGAGDFDGTPMECYCGEVMGDDGDLDEKRKCWVCVARAALAAEEGKRMASEWISVKDRLPEDGVEVLACKGAFVAMDGGFASRYVAWLDYDTSPPQWIISGEPTDEITHWQPLPAPPEDSNG